MVRNENILKDILLKMNYDPSKTLNENIEEQMGEKSWMKPRGMTDKEHRDILQGNYEPVPLTKKQQHLLLDLAAIGTLFIPVIGPLVSLGLELANAGLYYTDGDKYEAGFALAFALIPGGELIGKIPSVKKLGRDGLASLIKKARKGGKLTKTEFEAVEQITKNTKWLRLNALKQTIKLKAKNVLKNATLENVVYGMYKLSKKHPIKFNISKYGLLIGGVWYTYDKLAKMYGIGEEENTKDSKIHILERDFQKDKEKNIEQISSQLSQLIPKLDSTTDEDTDKEITNMFDGIFDEIFDEFEQ